MWGGHFVPTIPLSNIMKLFLIGTRLDALFGPYCGDYRGSVPCQAQLHAQRKENDQVCISFQSVIGETFGCYCCCMNVGEEANIRWVMSTGDAKF